MKKIFLISLLFVTIMSACGNNDDEWKDSVASYGDGTYQIIHHRVDNKSVEILTNCKHN